METKKITYVKRVRNYLFDETFVRRSPEGVSLLRCNLLGRRFVSDGSLEQKLPTVTRPTEGPFKPPSPEGGPVSRELQDPYPTSGRSTGPSGLRADRRLSVHTTCVKIVLWPISHPWSTFYITPVGDGRFLREKRYSSSRWGWFVRGRRHSPS